MYDDLASLYDTMTQFDLKWKNQKEFWKNIVEQHSADSLLDFGCGTGFHSILLGDIGLEVVGIDPSREMIAQGKKNLEKYSPNSSVQLIQGDLLTLAKQHRKFDWIFCIGNTLPHFTNPLELEEFLILSYQRLQPFGTFWLQLLNYKKILNDKKRLINITGDDQHTFVRFYDFKKESLDFNLLTITKKDQQHDHHWLQTELKPYTVDDLHSTFKKLAIFEKVETFSNFKNAPFRPEESDNLVILAHKLNK